MPTQFPTMLLSIDDANPRFDEASSYAWWLEKPISSHFDERPRFPFLLSLSDVVHSFATSHSDGYLDGSHADWTLLLWQKKIGNSTFSQPPCDRRQYCEYCVWPTHSHTIESNGVEVSCATEYKFRPPTQWMRLFWFIPKDIIANQKGRLGGSPRQIQIQTTTTHTLWHNWQCRDKQWTEHRSAKMSFPRR